ncbi:hypothetical protein N4P33_07970 [Streptomyces sp. 15-116A]|uniref:SAV_915 family protein n=1 Tax=Streptomyces sp. 15-116A TaxID=2259035 RepID=UPI0021B293DB|nr:SAV_915 family protein [Streptomyces sp. 15-116A]MCT7352110.1 hypothetical protein [Streptomyces sp. 15-116A]
MTSSEMLRPSPEYLVLPTLSEVRHSPDDGPSQDGTIEVTLLPVTGDDGVRHLAALAFSSVSLLVEAMGEQQSWVIVPAAELEGALRGSGAQAVLVDPQLAGSAE